MACPVARRAAETMARWRPRIRRRCFLGGAASLALAEAQEALGRPVQPMPDGAARRSAALRLAMETRAVFGPSQTTAPGPRVIARVDAAEAADHAILAGLLRAGISVLSLDASRGDPVAWRGLAVLLRRTSRETGRACRLMVELPPAPSRAALGFAAAEAAMVVPSGLRGAEDVARLRGALARQARPRLRQALVLRVEGRAALAALPEMLVEAAGQQPAAVLVARDELAGDLGPAALPAAQARALRLAAAAHLPAICAGGLLEAMLREGMPAGAEAMDAAEAARLAGAVMLDSGPHQAAAARLLRELGRRGRASPEAAARMVSAG